MFLALALGPTADRESGFLGLLHSLILLVPDAPASISSFPALLSSRTNDASHTLLGLGRPLGQPVPKSGTSGPGRYMQQVPHNY